MVIDAEELKYWIENFYGYGSWEARFWFVGYEENSGDTLEEVAEKLGYFHSTRKQGNPKLCDIREMYRHIKFRIEGPREEKFDTFHDHRFGKRPTLHGTWKNLIAFVHGYRNKKLPDLVKYQKDSFATASKTGATEALIQLYPLPAHHHAWYYGWLDLPQFPFLKKRTAYEEHVYPGRIRHILQNVSVYKPEVVVMYGMKNINELKKSVHEVFPASRFKMIKAIKQKIPQFHRADIDGTILLITTQVPNLRHNRIETGFDWYALGKLVKGGVAG